MSGFEWVEFASDGLVGCAVIAGMFGLGWSLGVRSGTERPSLT